jgi:AGZA family xanthine/uracil permease-like MFS transporter
MGGRAAYTLATALFVGAVGVTGGFGVLFAYLPTAAMFPILVFVGLEITAQSFQATPTRHYPALALAVLPALAYLATVVLKQVFGPATPGDPRSREVLQTLRCLSNGFLISSMLWAAALAMILDHRFRAAAAFFAVAAVFALFGVIHSPLADEAVGLPWHIVAQIDEAFRVAVSCQTPYHWAASYLLVAALLLALARLKPAEEKTAGPALEGLTEGAGPMEST